DADALVMAEGNMSRALARAPVSVRRSRRPHSTPRNFMHENRETSETPAVEPGRRSAGEGKRRTAPGCASGGWARRGRARNHSNKDGFPSAEDEEGRLRIKENTFPFDTYPTPSGAARVPRVGERAAKPCLAVIHPR